MDTPLFQFLANSIPFLVTLGAQGTLLLLPVNLKNWTDDGLNALFYLGFQMFIAGILFFIIPFLVEGQTPSTFGATLILTLVFFASCIRVIKMIPLEFTDLSKPEVELGKTISFVELFDPQRLNTFSTMPLQDPAEEARYLQLHERLVKRLPAKV